MIHSDDFDPDKIVMEYLSTNGFKETLVEFEHELNVQFTSTVPRGSSTPVLTAVPHSGTDEKLPNHLQLHSSFSGRSESDHKERPSIFASYSDVPIAYNVGKTLHTLEEFIRDLRVDDLLSFFSSLRNLYFTNASESLIRWENSYESSVFKNVLLNAFLSGRKDIVIDYLRKVPDRAYQADWRDWFRLPFLKDSAELEKVKAFRPYLRSDWADNFGIETINILSGVFSTKKLPEIFEILSQKYLQRGMGELRALMNSEMAQKRSVAEELERTNRVLRHDIERLEKRVENAKNNAEISYVVSAPAEIEHIVHRISPSGRFICTLSWPYDRKTYSATCLYLAELGSTTNVALEEFLTGIQPTFIRWERVSMDSDELENECLYVGCANFDILVYAFYKEEGRKPKRIKVIKLRNADIPIRKGDLESSVITGILPNSSNGSITVAIADIKNSRSLIVSNDYTSTTKTLYHVDGVITHCISNHNGSFVIFTNNMGEILVGDNKEIIEHWRLSNDSEGDAPEVLGLEMSSDQTRLAVLTREKGSTVMTLTIWSMIEYSKVLQRIVLNERAFGLENPWELGLEPAPAYYSTSWSEERQDNSEQISRYSGNSRLTKMRKGVMYINLYNGHLASISYLEKEYQNLRLLDFFLPGGNISDIFYSHRFLSVCVDGDKIVVLCN